MNIEIVDFYPFEYKNNFLTGTLHIYLCDYNADLRGIYVLKKKDKWFFKWPSRKALDKDTGKLTEYPFFSPCNPKDFKELTQLLIAKGRKYIEENFLTKNLPMKNKKPIKLQKLKRLGLIGVIK